MKAAAEAARCRGCCGRRAAAAEPAPAGAPAPLRCGARGGGSRRGRSPDAAPRERAPLPATGCYATVPESAACRRVVRADATDASPCCSSSGSAIPAPRYVGNRHNIGFMAVDAIAKRHSFGPWRRRFQGVAAEGPIGGERVLLLLPGTFMNESGRAVAEAAHFYKLDARRHRGVPRRDRPAARQGAGEDRRRQRRAQRPALDHRAYRQRLSPRAHRRRSSRRQGAGARATC